MLEKMQLQESPEVTSAGSMVYLDSLKAGSTAVTVQSLLTVDGTKYVGYPYTMEYTFSTQYRRTQGIGGSQLTDTSGRLQLREFKLLFEDSGRFNVTTTSQGVSHSYALR